MGKTQYNEKDLNLQTFTFKIKIISEFLLNIKNKFCFTMI